MDPVKPASTPAPSAHRGGRLSRLRDDGRVRRQRLRQWMWRLRWTPGPNRIEHSAHGPLIVNVHDQWVGAAFRRGEYWDTTNIRRMQTLVDVKLEGRASVCFYDVGANIGSHTLAMARLFGDRIRVRAFEAQRPVYYMLCGTVALNNLRNVTCHLCAVSDRAHDWIESRLPNYDVPNNFGGFELMPPMRSTDGEITKGTEIERIETVTLDSFDEPVDLIKFDIEGMEDRALAGATTLISRHRPFCVVEMDKTDGETVDRFFAERDYVRLEGDGDAIFIPREDAARVRAAR